MAVLEVIQHAQNGAVVVIGSQRSYADVLQGDLLAIIICLQVLNAGLEVQDLSGRKECSARAGIHKIRSDTMRWIMLFIVTPH